MFYWIKSLSDSIVSDEAHSLDRVVRLCMRTIMQLTRLRYAKTGLRVCILDIAKVFLSFEIQRIN